MLEGFPVAAVYGVMNIINDSGFIARFCRMLGFTSKPGLLYSMKGIVVSNLWFSIPFATMMMMMSASLSAVSDSYVESARDAGCGKLQVLRSVVLPLMYRDIILAATFIGMGQIASFTIPYLTGPNNPKMLGILLYTQVATYMDYQHAAALSVLIFLLCLALFLCGAIEKGWSQPF